MMWLTKLVMGVLALGLVAAWAAVPSDPLDPPDIAASEGKVITVTGRISEVFTDPKSGMTFLDIGGSYPDNTFTAVIWPESRSAFSDTAALEGKTVKITGLVQSYKDKPEIILRSAGQLVSQ